MALRCASAFRNTQSTMSESVQSATIRRGWTFGIGNQIPISLICERWLRSNQQLRLGKRRKLSVKTVGGKGGNLVPGTLCFVFLAWAFGLGFGLCFWSLVFDPEHRRCGIR